MTEFAALPVLDLTNFRDITDGDRELEAMLFAEFISGTGASTAMMETGISAAPIRAWQDAAHSIKGSARNLGAERLAAAASAAQDYEGADPAARRALLDDITREFAALRAALAAEGG